MIFVIIFNIFVKLQGLRLISSRNISIVLDNEWWLMQNCF